VPKLIITRGLPASGKSTKARAWVAEDPQRRARINRDDLRAMAHESVFVPQSDTDPGTERAIQAARDAAITALLKRGIDVVSDDTNLPTRTARDLRKLAVLAGADFEVWDLADVPIEECLRRNALRTGTAHVPEGRIRDMYDRHVRQHFPQPLPLPDEPTEDLPDDVYVPPPDAPEVVLVDIDGTLADMGKGLPGRRGPYDWARVGEDEPITPVVELVRSLRRCGYQIAFMSGRDESCRVETVKWLYDHRVGRIGEALYMRPAGDMRKDSIVKRELFDTYIAGIYAVKWVIDDRAQVVKMWRAMGLTVLAVADGDF
jgi:predicted kinase